MVFGTNNPYPTPAGSFPLPVVPPTDDPDVFPRTTVCFSQEWLPYVIAALQQLTLQATWQGSSGDVETAISRAQLLLAMFGADDGGCVNTIPIIDVRYDSGCDCIQKTFDGGSTWIDNPSLDPRHSPIYLFPPNTDADQRCQAAANMVRYISDLIDEVILVVDTAGAAEGLVAILMPLLLDLGPFGILIDLVLGVGFLLFSAGATAISAAFTSTAYDTLNCIFYCNISPEGMVSSGALMSILDDINTQIGGLVYVVLTGMFGLMGEVGLSNAGAIGSAPQDCSACTGCGWSHTFDFDASPQDWNPNVLTPASASWGGTSPLHWGGVAVSGLGSTQLDILSPTFDSRPINSIDVNCTANNIDGNRPTVILYLAGVQQARVDITNSVGANISGTQTAMFSAVTADQIRVAIICRSVTTDNVFSVTANGDGSNPF